MNFPRLQRRHPHPPAQQSPAVVCPECASHLVQLQSWKELSNGSLLLHLRCPECELRIADTFEERLVAEYDRTLVEARKAITAGYEHLVRHNMAEFADGFTAALEMDLIGADDFAVRRQARCSAR
jgi:DNA-directed RNA polymerase subunit RPC12/RpoP